MQHHQKNEHGNERRKRQEKASYMCTRVHIHEASHVCSMYVCIMYTCMYVYIKYTCIYIYNIYVATYMYI